MAVDWNTPADDVETQAILAKLNELREEHRVLDSAIAALAENAPYDQLGLMRLKRRKLALKDEIAKWEDALTPDIIA